MLHRTVELEAPRPGIGGSVASEVAHDTAACLGFTLMALARAVVAGALLCLACVVVGHSTAAPSPRSVVVVAAPDQPSTGHGIARAAANYEPPPRTTIVHASRGSTRPRVVRASASDDDQQLAIAEICSYEWPCDLAVRVASCESGLRWWAANAHSSARGIFQILGGPLDLRANVALAHSMWQRRGWSPWNASRRCWA